MDESESGWEPLMAFIDGSPSFAHGFEAGGIWAELSGDFRVLHRTVHVANLDQYRRMAVHFKQTLEITDYDHEWAFVSFFPDTFFGWVRAAWRGLTW